MNKRKLHLLTEDEECIIALCTPRGSGAIAILRLCGTNSIDIVTTISKLSSGSKLSDLPTHTIHHGYVLDYHTLECDKGTEKIVDEVLFFLMRSPRTFTGQDTVEISCHNNSFIIQKIIDLAIFTGARLARHGEFTKRAFLNNKIDLIQAESINDLINAQTELALKKSMAQLQGSFSSYLVEIETDLVGILSLVEGSFEFFEEEKQDLNIDEMVNQRISELSLKFTKLKENFNQQQTIKNGIKVCILGWVNAGKSTLFNALLGKNRAIVTDLEGTARDSIESNMYKNGNFWLLIDTAGLRQTDDFIEQKGIEFSWQQADHADIILLAFDLSKKFTKQQLQAYKDIFAKYNDKIIAVANKSDIENLENEVLKQLSFIDSKKFIKVSALSRSGIDLLENKIEEKIQEIFSKCKSPFLLNQRQYNLIVELEKKLEFIVNEYLNPIEYELVAYHLNQMLENLSELTGRNVAEKVLDRVFKDFCIGK